MKCAIVIVFDTNADGARQLLGVMAAAKSRLKLTGGVYGAYAVEGEQFRDVTLNELAPFLPGNT
jgi:hypothetical protein